MSTRGVKKRPWRLSPVIIVSIFSFCCWLRLLEGKCVPRMGCSRALAFYTVKEGDTLNDLANRYQTTIDDVKIYNDIPNADTIKYGDGNYLLFPFPCECDGNLLGHSFTYQVQQDDTLGSIEYFNEGLTRVAWMEEANNYDSKSIVYPGTTLKVPVNCSCGNSSVSHDYGLFTTYPATASDSVSSIATKFKLREELLRQYNPSVNPSGNLSTWDIIFIPSQEFRTGLYPPYNFSDEGSSKTNQGLVIGLSVGGGVAVLLLVLLLWSLFCIFFPRKRARKGMHHSLEGVESGFSDERRSGLLNFSRNGAGGSAGTGHGGSAAFPDFTVDKSVEFSFEELAAGTNNFNVANKIGEGGYGSVYLANLRGQRLAVKRMNLQATREFLAEIQVLTHVHHTNLVQLIGYCTVDSLFLIYEYVENGTLDRHLHGSHNLPPLSWPARVQIALDAARGLEYIHEHTKPTYIHRDVKSSNILIDKQFHAKVADFGLTKLTESGIANQSLTIPTRLVGTFGYMSPEYARFGDVSPKVDVYSFGVVLFEIISAKEAIVRSTGHSTSGGPRKEEQRGLVTLFEDVLNNVDGREKLQRLVDPALGKNYPPEAAWKMAQLAGACTEENPARRPSMRTAVVALMTLSSTTQGWEMGGFGSDSVMTGWMSGR